MKSTRPTRQPEREPNQIEPGSSRQGEAQTVIPVLQEELEVHTRRVETPARSSSLVPSSFALGRVAASATWGTPRHFVVRVVGVAGRTGRQGCGRSRGATPESRLVQSLEDDTRPTHLGQPHRVVTTGGHEVAAEKASSQKCQTGRR